MPIATSTIETSPMLRGELAEGADRAQGQHRQPAGQAR